MTERGIIDRANSFQGDVQMSLQGTAENGVIVLDGPQRLADGTRVEVIVHEAPLLRDASPPKSDEKRPRTSLADWAETNAENWGSELSSADVEGFTGRRY
jgi:hypothetical protein